MSSPVPEFIAAVMPTTRASRRHSSTSASPNTFVYCGGLGLAGAPAAPCAGSVFEAAWRLTIDDGLAACHFSMPSSPPSSAGAKPLPLIVFAGAADGRSASGGTGEGRFGEEGGLPRAPSVLQTNNPA